jgi:hypothetical protein
MTFTPQKPMKRSGSGIGSGETSCLLPLNYGALRFKRGHILAGAVLFWGGLGPVRENLCWDRAVMECAKKGTSMLS